MLYANGKQCEKEKRLCPPPVEGAHQVKLFGEQNRDKEQRKENKEEERKNKKAVIRVELMDNFHQGPGRNR